MLLCVSFLMAPQFVRYVAKQAGTISGFMSCATILTFRVALACDLCHRSQAPTVPESDGHFGHAVRVGEDGRRGPEAEPEVIQSANRSWLSSPAGVA